MRIKVGVDNTAQEVPIQYKNKNVTTAMTSGSGGRNEDQQPEQLTLVVAFNTMLDTI